jgi:hypothetical protein
MKQLLLFIGLIVSILLLIISIFSGGRIILFGTPVSGLLFVVIFRALAREMDK